MDDDENGWSEGNYALDRENRLWHAHGYSFGRLMWRGLGWADDQTTDELTQFHGPLRRVQVVEVCG